MPFLQADEHQRAQQAATEMAGNGSSAKSSMEEGSLQQLHPTASESAHEEPEGGDTHSLPGIARESTVGVPSAVVPELEDIISSRSSTEAALVRASSATGSTHLSRDDAPAGPVAGDAAIAESAPSIAGSSSRQAGKSKVWSIKSPTNPEDHSAA